MKEVEKLAAECSTTPDVLTERGQHHDMMAHLMRLGLLQLSQVGDGSDELAPSGLVAVTALDDEVCMLTEPTASHDVGTDVTWGCLCALARTAARRRWLGQDLLAQGRECQCFGRPMH